MSLIGDLQREHGAAVILITHNMGVVAEMADRVVIMHDGRLIEQGTCHAIFAAQSQEYTRHLLAAYRSSGDGWNRPAVAVACWNERGR